MDERVRIATAGADLDHAGRLLHEFNSAYDDPSPGSDALTARLTSLVGTGDTEVLLGAERPDADPMGVAVVRYRPSLWSGADEAYLAELWVDPAARGGGLGRALLRASLEQARKRPCDLLDLSTSEDDVAARRLYESEGLHATEGLGGPTTFHYEIDL